MIRWCLRNGSLLATTGVPVSPIICSGSSSYISVTGHADHPHEGVMPDGKADRPAAALIPYGGMFEAEATAAPPECTIVVDVGYSYTHVVPIRGTEIVWEHVKRYVCPSVALPVQTCGWAWL